MARLEPRLRREFLQMLIAIRDKHTQRQIAEMVVQGRTQELMATVRREAAVFADAVNAAFERSGQQAAGFVAEKLGTRVRFEAIGDRSTAIMRSNRLRIVGDIAAEQEAVIRRALEDGTRAGLNPRETARSIRNSIGLTDTQEQAVRNYRSMLERGDAEALQRELRDRRYDRMTQRAVAGEPLTPAQLDRMTERYRARYLRYRSEVIARTESLRATHQGTEEAFNELAEGGAVNGRTMVSEWFATGGGRTRDSHRAMHGQTRPFGEPFVSGLGNKLRFPGDPQAPIADTAQCRCSVATRFERAA